MLKVNLQYSHVGYSLNSLKGLHRGIGKYDIGSMRGIPGVQAFAHIVLGHCSI